MSGTCLTFITALARSTASWCSSAKVPVAAYTSIIGISWPLLIRRPGAAVSTGHNGDAATNTAPARPAAKLLRTNHTQDESSAVIDGIRGGAQRSEEGGVG